MTTKQEFFDAALNILSDDPRTSVAVQVQDPRLLQSIKANAQMLAMLSEHIDVASNEPFEKVRDATIYADAAAKGIMPYARSGVVTVNAKNNTGENVAFNAGRLFFDQKGRTYQSLATVNMPFVYAGANSYPVQLRQVEKFTQTEVVADSIPLYKVAIKKPVNEKEYLTSIEVYVNDVMFSYSKDYTNVFNGDKSYSIEIDEYQVMSIVFGYDNVVGYQPNSGDVVRIEMTRCNGDIDGKSGDEFSLLNMSEDERDIQFTLASIDDVGSKPIKLDVLRELCKYPAIYTDNAVYLGNFDFLIRKHYPDILFLSVWNEQIEESVRGANIVNINKLFVSFCPPSGITEAQMQAYITELVRKADDGYRVVFKTRIDVSPVIAVTAKISVVHDSELVKTQIKGLLLSKYGQDSSKSRKGMYDIKTKDVSELLKSEIPALADTVSDFTVAVTNPTSILPEQWRYLAMANITVTTTAILNDADTWGA